MLGPPISLCPITTMAWTHPYLAILTSATTPYKEAKGNDAKARILAATVRDIMAKAQEHSQVQTGIEAVKCRTGDTHISGRIPSGFDHSP